MAENRLETLLAIVARYDLNEHPFYQEWRAGTLPVEKLTAYAREYGAFVGTIGLGWEAVGRDVYVQEEAGHVRLWADFATKLDAKVGGSRPQTAALVSVAENLFAQRPEAVGALFAFEAQQPSTAASKLAGLEEHYDLSGAACEYFRVHARQHSEYDELVEMAEAMTPDDFARAKSACALMAAAMWSGLDGVYYAAA
jgi:pyrroloquinoline-quinone synthase